MKKYSYDKRWPWDIAFRCDRSNTHLLLRNCTFRVQAKGSHCPSDCKDRANAIKQRLKDMSIKDQHGIMMGCFTCRYCIYFHKQPRTVKDHGFICPKHGRVPCGNPKKYINSEIDTWQCEYFHLKKFIHCPHRNKLIMCNDCLWDYHTQQPHCKKCQVFTCSANNKLKIKPKLKLKKKLVKKKPKLKLRRK